MAKGVGKLVVIPSVWGHMGASRGTVFVEFDVNVLLSAAADTNKEDRAFIRETVKKFLAE